MFYRRIKDDPHVSLLEKKKSIIKQYKQQE